MADFSKKCEFLELIGILHKSKINLNTLSTATKDTDEKIKLRKHFFNKIPASLARKRNFFYREYKNKDINFDNLCENLNKFQADQLVYNSTVGNLNKTKYISYDYDKYCNDNYYNDINSVNTENNKDKANININENRM